MFVTRSGRSCRDTGVYIQGVSLQMATSMQQHVDEDMDEDVKRGMEQVAVKWISKAKHGRTFGEVEIRRYWNQSRLVYNVIQSLGYGSRKGVFIIAVIWGRKVA